LSQISVTDMTCLLRTMHVTYVTHSFGVRRLLHISTR